MKSSSSSTSNISEADSENISSKSILKSALNSKYTWTADLVWRNRSFKDLHVFFDSVAGQLGFCKSKNEQAIYSSNIL